jgi:hypothetical protein
MKNSKETPKTFKELFANTGIEPTTDESGNTHYNFKATLKEEPNPADFMKLGEDEFNKNVHEKLRETLSTNEKQMWISGYLLALTQQSKR